MIFENFWKIFNILQNLVKSADFCKRPKLLPNNWKKIYRSDSFSTEKQWSHVMGTIYCKNPQNYYFHPRNVTFIERTPHCWHRFQQFSGKLLFEQKYTRNIFYFHLSSSNYTLLVIVWTRIPERFCLQIFLWERRKKWFALSEAINIL